MLCAAIQAIHARNGRAKRRIRTHILLKTTQMLDLAIITTAAIPIRGGRIRGAT